MLAAQLYTLREATKTREGFVDCLRRLAEIGYQGVQLSAVGCMAGEAPEVDVREARELLDRFHLKCAATHRPWPRFLANLSEEIETHKVLGCDYAAIGSLPGEYGSAEGYRRFLSEAAPVARKLEESGISFGYHNHSHEFARDAATRERLIDILIDEGGPLIMMELDTYWVAHAGADPALFVRRCDGRVRVIHVKDTEVVPGEGPVMAPVGEGNQNWSAIIDAGLASGVEWWTVEQDECRRDPFDCLKSSFDFLSAALGST